MRDSESHGDRLDAAIDRAVRDLLNVEPRTDLRERVLAEIGSRTPAFFAWPRLAVAAATLAIVALSTLMLWRQPTPQQPEHAVVSTQPTVIPTAPGSNDSSKPPSVPAPARHSQLKPRPHQDRSVVVSPAQGDRLVQAASIDLAGAPDDPPAVDAPAIEGLAPIYIPAIQTAPISTPVTSLVPIRIERIDLPPLKR